MDDEPLALVEREVKSCPGVTTDETGGLRKGRGWVRLGHRRATG